MSDLELPAGGDEEQDSVECGGSSTPAQSEEASCSVGGGTTPISGREEDDSVLEEGEAGQSDYLDSDKFEELQEAEWKKIRERRERLGRVEEEELTGLCLSGGGIRSAVFALGGVQALEERGLLSKIDYLSTVSGGGYLGSALTWWSREGSPFLSEEKQVEDSKPRQEAKAGGVRQSEEPEQNDPTEKEGESFCGHEAGEREEDTQGNKRPEEEGNSSSQHGGSTFPFASPVGGAALPRLGGKSLGQRLYRYVREHSQYLTPGNGLSLLSLCAVVARGAIVSVFVWVTLFAMLLSLEALGLEEHRYLVESVAVLLLLPLTLFLLTHAWVFCRQRVTNPVLRLVAFPFLLVWNVLTIVAALLAPAIYLEWRSRWWGWWLSECESQGVGASMLEVVQRFWYPSALSVLLVGISTIFGLLAVWRLIQAELAQGEERESALKAGLVSSSLGGLVGVFALLSVLNVSSADDRLQPPELFLVGACSAGLAFAVNCVLYATVTTLPSPASSQYGGRRLFDTQAPWLLGAMLGMLFLGSPKLAYTIIDKDQLGWFGLGFLLVGLVVVAGVLKRLGEEGGRGISLELLAVSASLLLLFGGIYLGYELSVEFLNEGYFLGWVAMMLGAVLVALTANINRLSIHRYYRDRLMELFMPDPERALAHQAGAAREVNVGSLSHMVGAGPYHLINANVVLVGSDDRTRRTRGGDSFLLSPLYCGSKATGWSNTQQFEGGRMTLATAMAVSGAAASPRTGAGGRGVTRNSVVSMLMALLNLRTGYWAQRPQQQARTWSRLEWKTPNFLFPGLQELFGFGFTGRERHVLLTDGGHFENLGLYELVRRRVDRILLLDATADPRFEFQDLWTAMERVESDFGVRIVMEGLEGVVPMPMERLDPEGGDARWAPLRAFFQQSGGVSCAVRGHATGIIHYPAGFGKKAKTGSLIYVKSTFLGERLSPRTWSYKRDSPSFPDDTTADQFFHPEQFDAYRELGHAQVQQLFDPESPLDAAHAWVRGEPAERAPAGEEGSISDG